MTLRQQKALNLHKKGFTNMKVAELMNISQSTVSDLLDLNRGLYIRQKKYRKTKQAIERIKQRDSRYRKANKKAINLKANLRYKLKGKLYE
ncbi:hypothetical protein LCGC14_2719260 [marine sediment metagenome]|uniref:Uncharacterized protein n=1 Tax=marine sediment metagenome TaxID=412755 RepID=A0A0F8ZAM3_9ZZZZ